MSLTSSAKGLGAGIAAMYRRYAEWLVSISWKRFMLLSLVLLIVAGILSGLPPFTWDLVEPKIVNSKHARPSRDVDVTVDERGVRIKPKREGSTEQPGEATHAGSIARRRRLATAAFGRAQFEPT